MTPNFLFSPVKIDNFVEQYKNKQHKSTPLAATLLLQMGLAATVTWALLNSNHTVVYKYYSLRSSLKNNLLFSQISSLKHIRYRYR